MRDLPRSVLVGGVGLLIAMVGWFVDPEHFHLAWIAGLSAWLGWPLGSMALLMVHALTGGRWGDAIRPALLLGVGTLPLLLPAILPLVIGLSSAYPWARDGVHLDNAFYLNTPFFAGRGVVYLIAWFGLGALVTRRPQAVERFAAPGLLVLAVTLTFAAIDLTMSLDPTFNSSAYGMIAAAGSALFALAIAILLTAAQGPKVRADLSRVLLGLVVLWAYLDFIQFLIVWESDLASESIYYVFRSHGFWGIAAVCIGLLHFLLPFAALIFPRVQQSRVGLAGIAALLVVMEVVRNWWLVLPPHVPNWIDLGVLLGFAGFATALLRPRRAFAHA